MSSLSDLSDLNLGKSVDLGGATGTGNLTGSISAQEQRLLDMEAGELAEEDVELTDAEKDAAAEIVVHSVDSVTSNEDGLREDKAAYLVMLEDPASTTEDLAKLEKRIAFRTSEGVTLAAELDAKQAELAKKGVTWEKVKDNLEILGAAGGVYSAFFKKDKGPSVPSAAETLKDLSGVTAGREFGINQQIANYGPGLAGDALEDPEILAEWDAANRPDFNTWVQSVMQDPTSPTARKLAEMLDPLNVAAGKRVRRLDEARDIRGTYPDSAFRSPEQQAAVDYAAAVAADPLDIQLGEYIGQELAGEYDPEWYRDIREKAFERVHPSMVAAGPGMQAALFDTAAAKQQRQQAGASMAHQTLGRKMAYTGPYVASTEGYDPLAMTGVGKMPLGDIPPMDPTGPFFASFPARQQDALMAAYDSQKSLGDKMTALQQLAETAAGVYDRRRENDPLRLLGGQ